MAPAVKMPSMPRLSTPARSQTSSPSVPKISGVAMRSAAAQKLAVARISSISSMARPCCQTDAVAHDEAAEEHGEKRRRHDQVGDVARHADRAAHRVGADEDGGDEDGG